ncbi:S8 family serine peptidase [Butyricimonas hominis]|uniref:S8 family serine peptidase n=1 Tax=Butyricimonas hominis TaxID=2763032 RepID=UPI0035147C1D
METHRLMNLARGGMFGIAFLFCIACQDKNIISGTEPDSSADGLATGVVYVQFQREQIAAYASDNGGNRTVGKWENVNIKRVFPPAGKFEERHKAFGLDLWYKIEVPEGTRAQDVVDYFSVQDGVLEVAEERVIPEPMPLPVTVSAFGRGEGERLPFNDPYLGKQWHYDRTGSVETADNAHIGLFKGWEVTGGNRDVIVAVLDVGGDYLHEDLKDNIWINEKELNGVAGTDDDNNGYTDDIYGYNFVAGSGTISREDHGTHVAGTIAAVNNNGIGVCGIAGGTGKGDGVRIMLNQVGTYMGGVTQNWEALANAFVYAADNGAVICQCSWAFPYSNSLLKQGIEYFTENAGSREGSPMRGGMVVVASGNDGRHTDTYPASYEVCISVAAVTNQGKKATYSNYDESVDISAPGGERAPSESGIFSTLANNKYGYMNGTSMACPHVSGIAALIVSAHAGKDFTAARLKEILLESVMSIEDSEPEYAPLMGKGVARADLALWKNDGVAPEKVRDLQFKQENEGYYLVWSNASDQNDGSPRKCNLYRSGQPLNAADLDRAEMEEIDLRGKEAGERITVELPKPANRNTIDYYALTSADPWGNVSGLSNVVEIRWAQVLPEEEPEPEKPETPEKGIVVYPNPTTGILNVKWGNAQGAKSVNVYDLMARRVFTKILSNNKNSGEETVDISRLPAGRYVLKFSSDEGVQAVNVIKI